MKNASSEELLATFNSFVPQVKKDAKDFIDSKYREFLQDEKYIVDIIWANIEAKRNNMLDTAPEEIRQAFEQKVEKSLMSGFIQEQWQNLHPPKDSSNPDE